MLSIRAFARSGAVIAAAALTAFAIITISPAAGVSAGPDVSGTWDIEVTGDLPGPCTSIIVQDGTALSSVAECSLVGTLIMDGTIDPATGDFTLTEGPLDVLIEGTFAADGNTLAADWSGLGGAFTGQITGTRTSTDTEIVDISGDYTFVFVSYELTSFVCDATLTQSFTGLTADITCESGTTVWTGGVSPLSGSFNLDDGEFGYIFATPTAEDPSLLQGSWGGVESFGRFYAYPAGTANTGILSVGCRTVTVGSGFCFAEPGTAIGATVDVTLPPSDGYDGFHIELLLEGNLPYVPAAVGDEAPACPAAERSIVEGPDVTTITFACDPADFVPGTAPLISLGFACPAEPEYAYALLNLTENTYLTLEGSQLAPLAVTSTHIECFAPFPEPVPAPLPSLPYEAFLAADVDCNDRTDSIDAALVLQKDAGLIDAFACEHSGDASLDGATNSIDASVILQMVAGLVVVEEEPLPPVP